MRIVNTVMGNTNYINLKDKKDIDLYCHSDIFSTDDNVSMNILREFIKWRGSDEIDQNMISDEYDQFCCEVDFTKFKIEKLV